MRKSGRRLGAQIGHGQKRVTQVQRKIPVGVLGGVPHFVCGHRQSGQMAPPVDPRRQPHHLVSWIVVVGQRATHLFHGNIENAVFSEQAACRLGSADAGSRGDLAELGIRFAHPPLCVQRHDYARNEYGEIPHGKHHKCRLLTRANPSVPTLDRTHQNIRRIVLCDTGARPNSVAAANARRIYGKPQETGGSLRLFFV